MQSSRNNFPIKTLIFIGLCIVAPQLVILFLGISALIFLLPFVAAGLYMWLLKFKVKQAAARASQQQNPRSQNTSSKSQSSPHRGETIDCQDYRVISED